VSRRPTVTDPARTIAVAAVLVAVALTVPVLAWRGLDTLRSSKAGRLVQTTLTRPRALPDTPATVVVLTGRDGRPAGLVVVALAPGGGGSLLPLPLAAATVLSASGEAEPLGSSWDVGGLPTLADATASLLRISVSASYAVDEAGLTDALRPATPLDVTLPDDVRDTDASGAPRVLQPAGARRLTAAEAAQVLLARAPDEPELARLPRIAAVWTAVADRLAATGRARAGAAGASAPPGSPTSSDPAPSEADSPPPTVPVPASAADAVARLATGPVRVHLVPVVEDVKPPQRPAGVAELLRLDEVDLRLVVADVLPGAASPANGQLRFAIVDPFDDRELEKAAVARLSFITANVVLVEHSDRPPPASTQLAYDAPEVRDALVGYDQVLGSVDVVPATERIQGVQATVVLGQSFRQLVAAAATSTTSSIPPATSASTTASTSASTSGSTSRSTSPATTRAAARTTTTTRRP
jgi:hypothetical protein